MALRTVLVKVGGGKYLSFDDAEVESKTSGCLLEALAGTRAFESKLRHVALDECTVRVCASAFIKAPSTAEAAAARELEGGEVLGTLTAGLAGNLFIHVELPLVGASARSADAVCCHARRRPRDCIIGPRATPHLPYHPLPAPSQTSPSRF
jgi:hypothetical protein